ELTDPMRRLVALQQAASAEVARAVAGLRHFPGPESVRGPARAVHALEGEADAVHRAALEALFGEGAGPLELVRQKDMLLYLEEGLDRCKDAMDEIESVAAKNG